jgi:hypothetical protein
MTTPQDVQIDPRSTIAAQLKADLVKLTIDGPVSVDAIATPVLLAIARLEACIFGELDDPTIG